MQTDDLRLIIEQQLVLSQELRTQVSDLQDERHSPLAIVGTAMRLPGGVTTPEDYWSLLMGDADVVTQVPESRPGLRAVFDPRPDRPGHSYVDRASFLDEVAEFDAGFFGISAREAESMDPQQRLLLETSYEAMERAGIPMNRQRRLPAGVFVGIMASEYGERLSARTDKSGIDPYFGTGGGHCFAAGRVSYSMGFSGPALSVDTACSSSLVALHLASQSLRSRECRYALVGGTNLIFSADLMVSLSQSRALAPDGRCKTFSAAADGYGRGEGVGVLVLMRLADAERDGHPVLAVVRGSAVNHDGASSGLTVPNGPAQQELLLAALADARVEPHQVGWVEAHGTGTSLGDPIEVGALSVLAGPKVTQRHTPLAIGSVKSRLGHLEAASGIAGLLKLVLMLQRGILPPAIGPETQLNPLAPWSSLSVDVPRQAQPWPASYQERIAGISAFGLSGTNAHAVLSAYEPTETERACPPRRHPHLLTLSAKDTTALRHLAAAVAGQLDALAATSASAGPVTPGSVARSADDRLADLCHTMRGGRASYDCRLSLTGDSAAELSAGLTRWIDPGPETASDTERLVGKPVLRVSGDPRELSAGLAELSRAFGASQEQTPGDIGDDPLSQVGDTSIDVLTELLDRLGVTPAPVTVSPDGPSTVSLEIADLRWPLVGQDGQSAPALLLAALADLYRRGFPLHLAGLPAPGARILPAAPTYPFQRRRFWIEEPVDDSVPADISVAPHVAGATATGMATDAAAGEAGRAGDGSTPEARLPVQTFLLDELAVVLREDQGFDPQLSFLEVGGDSFAAMLLAKAFEQYYGVEVPIEEFAIDVPLQDLSLHLEGYLARLSGHAEQAERSA